MCCLQFENSVLNLFTNSTNIILIPSAMTKQMMMGLWAVKDFRVQAQSKDEDYLLSKG